MPKQVTTKRKAEGPNHTESYARQEAQEQSRQPALNSQPRSASATDSSLSESSPPPSLTSGSSIEDSSSSTSMLQETRPNHRGTQETEGNSWDKVCAMSREERQEYWRSLGLNDESSDESDIEYDPENDPYDKEIDALKYGGCKLSRSWLPVAIKEGWGAAFINAHIEQ